MSTFVSRKESILSRLRTSHNLRGIAQAATERIPNLSAEKSDGIAGYRISTMTSLMLHQLAEVREYSTEISQNLANVAQTTTCTAAMIAIDPSSSFVPISLQRDVIVVHRSGEIRNTLTVTNTTAYVVAVTRGGSVMPSIGCLDSVQQTVAIGSIICFSFMEKIDLCNLKTQWNDSYPQTVLASIGSVSLCLRSFILDPLRLWGIAMPSSLTTMRFQFKNLVVPPLVAITAATLSGMLSTSLGRISTGIRRHSSCNMALSWTMEAGPMFRRLLCSEVEKFKYLGAALTNINDTWEEIKHRINMGNACYYSVEKLLSSSMLSKNLKVRIYKKVILSVVLYGCETWTLTLREEHRLRVFENKTFEMGRARMGEFRNAYTVLVGRPDGKRPLGRSRRRREGNIKMDLREVGYDNRDWINLAQDRDQWRAYVRAAMNLRSAWYYSRHHPTPQLYLGYPEWISCYTERRNRVGWRPLLKTIVNLPTLFELLDRRVLAAVDLLAGASGGASVASSSIEDQPQSRRIHPQMAPNVGPQSRRIHPQDNEVQEMNCPAQGPDTNLG
ncbi:hypothetical protein ANN_09164 [Periplaneta americana]|uniref:Uncharacterized protein n=1 Tax=Periplaneta americana TaxID=6978 RepID=A0ABQ8TKL7_PERAM|nr:hypothetical protein ANN_09164 [Periplaneta americana]